MAITAAIMALGVYNEWNNKKSKMRELREQQEIGNRLINAGARLEQNDLDLQMEEAVLSSQEEGIFNSERLRGVLASQNVLAAARGVDSGAGTQEALRNSSIKNFNADEKARQRNLLSAQRGISNQKNISSLNQIGATFSLNSNIASQRREVRNAFNQKLLDTAGSFADSSMASTRKAPVETRTASQGYTTDYGRAYTKRTGRA